MKPLLNLVDVRVRRRGREILGPVSWQVLPDQHWAVLGPNGCGKTTLLNIAAAQLHPTSGVAEILTHRLGRVDVQVIRKSIGHVSPRHPIEYPLTVLEVILTGITGTLELPFRFDPKSAELEQARIGATAVGLGERLADRWQTLSQGERSRALIARALISQPQMLLLDEPATGLDLAGREQLLRTLSTLNSVTSGRATVIVSHHLEDLPTHITHALLLKNGQVVAQGEVGDVLTSAHVSAAFDFAVHISRSQQRWHAYAQ